MFLLIFRWLFVLPSEGRIGIFTQHWQIRTGQTPSRAVGGHINTINATLTMGADITSLGSFRKTRRSNTTHNDKEKQCSVYFQYCCVFQHGLHNVQKYRGVIITPQNISYHTYKNGHRPPNSLSTLFATTKSLRLFGKTFLHAKFADHNILGIHITRSVTLL